MKIRDPNNNVFDLAKMIQSPTAAVGQILIVEEVNEAGFPTKWKAVDIQSDDTSKYELLGDVTIEEDVSIVNVPLSKSDKTHFLLYVELPTGESVRAGYLFINEGLVDTQYQSIKENGKHWCQIDLVSEGILKFFFITPQTNGWDGTSANIGGKAVLFESATKWKTIQSIGLGGSVVTIPAGTRFRIWGK